MLDLVTNLFSRRNPQRDAKNCLARIISRYDMSRLSYEEGIEADRRCRDERHVAIGIWLFPQTDDCPAGEFNVEHGVPAVTHDIRSEGLGVMTPISLEQKRFVVATPDESERWRFFQTDVRHNTRKPGGWYMLGLQVTKLVEIEGDQAIEFREHISEVCAS